LTEPIDRLQYWRSETARLSGHSGPRLYQKTPPNIYAPEQGSSAIVACTRFRYIDTTNPYPPLCAEDAVEFNFVSSRTPGTLQGQCEWWHLCNLILLPSRSLTHPTLDPDETFLAVWGSFPATQPDLNSREVSPCLDKRDLDIRGCQMTAGRLGIPWRPSLLTQRDPWSSRMRNDVPEPVPKDDPADQPPGNYDQEELTLAQWQDMDQSAKRRAVRDVEDKAGLADISPDLKPLRIRGRAALSLVLRNETVGATGTGTFWWTGSAWPTVTDGTVSFPTPVDAATFDPMVVRGGLTVTSSAPTSTTSSPLLCTMQDAVSQVTCVSI